MPSAKKTKKTLPPKVEAAGKDPAWAIACLSDQIDALVKQVAELVAEVKTLREIRVVVLPQQPQSVPPLQPPYVAPEPCQPYVPQPWQPHITPTPTTPFINPITTITIGDPVEPTKTNMSLFDVQSAVLGPPAVGDQHICSFSLEAP